MEIDYTKEQERLYDEKSFIVPNGGDIKKVEINYEDWLWIEKFLASSNKRIAQQVVEKVRGWAEDNSKEISDSYPFDLKYDNSDFVSESDLLSFLKTLQD